MTAQKRIGDLTRIVEPEDVPPELVLLIDRLRTAIAEMATRAQPSLKQPNDDASTAEVRAIAERNRAIGAANALEFEIAPLLEGLDLAAIIGKVKAEAVAEYRRVLPQSRREALPLSTDIAILPGQLAQITTRPQRAAMRIDTIICSSPDFMIHDIRIGMRSQLAQMGSIPSAAFMANASGYSPRLAFETIQTAMDLVIEVEYVGANPAGEPFRAVALGQTERTAEADGLEIGTAIGDVIAVDPDDASAVLTAWQQVLSTYGVTAQSNDSADDDEIDEGFAE